MSTAARLPEGAGNAGGRVLMVARTARRRMMIRGVVERLGPALIAAAAGMLGIVLLDRLTAWRVPVWAAIGAPLAMSVGYAAIRGLRAAPSLLDAAAELDERVRLRDRLSTALSVCSDGDPFVALAVNDGERSAATIDASRAVPLRLGRAWRVAPVALAAAVAAWVLVPELSSGNQAQEARTRAEAERARGAAEQVQQAIVEAREALREVTPASAEQLSALEDLQRELDSAGESSAQPLATADEVHARRTPEEALSDGARALERMAEEQQALADAQKRESDELADMLSDLPTEPVEESALGQALRRSDMEAARQAVMDMARRAEQPGEPGDSGNDRARAASEMRKLADDLRALAEQREQAARTADRSDGATDGGADGARETAESVATSSTDPAQTRSGHGAGRSEGKPSATERAAREARELSQRLHDAADELGGAGGGLDERSAKQDGAEGNNARAAESEAAAAPSAPSTERAEGRESKQSQLGGETQAKGAQTSAESRGADGKQADPSSSKPNEAARPAQSQSTPADRDATPGEAGQSPARQSPREATDRTQPSSRQGESSATTTGSQSPQAGESGSPADAGKSTRDVQGREQAAANQDRPTSEQTTAGKEPVARETTAAKSDTSKSGGDKSPQQSGSQSNNTRVTGESRAGEGAKATSEQDGKRGESAKTAPPSTTGENGQEQSPPSKTAPDTPTTPPSARPDSQVQPAGSQASNREGAQPAGSMPQEGKQADGAPREQNKTNDQPTGSAGREQATKTPERGTGETRPERDPSRSGGAQPSNGDAQPGQPASGAGKATPAPEQPAATPTQVERKNDSGGDRTNTTGNSDKQQVGDRPPDAGPQAGGTERSAAASREKQGAAGSEPRDEDRTRSGSDPRSLPTTTPHAPGGEPPMRSSEAAAESKPAADDKQGAAQDKTRGTSALGNHKETGALDKPTAHSPGTERPSPQGNEQTRPNESNQREQQGQPADESQSPSQGGSAMKRLAEQLSRMSQTSRDAQKQQQNAERLMEQARRLYENASPEQRERMRQWAMEQASKSGEQGGFAPRATDGDSQRAPSPVAGDGGPRPKSGAKGDAPSEIRTEPIDARSASNPTKEGGEDRTRPRVIAEWLGEGDRRRGPAQQGLIDEQLREATRTAEQAIGDRSVSRRYDRVLQEYFRRLPAKVRSAASAEQTGSSGAAEPARDADVPASGAGQGGTGGR